MPSADQRAKQLVRHTINNFNITPDKVAVARVNESLSTLQQARELRLHDAENALKSQFSAVPSAASSDRARPGIIVKPH